MQYHCIPESISKARLNLKYTGKTGSLRNVALYPGANVKLNNGA